MGREGESRGAENRGEAARGREGARRGESVSRLHVCHVGGEKRPQTPGGGGAIAQL